jgi:aminopeptidase-like protein
MNMADARSEDALASGEEMHSFAQALYPICRSLTGDGVRKTLGLIKQILPELVIREVPSGTVAFDWTVPDEWNIRTAYIEDPSGRRVVDFAHHNLHVVGYSTPVDVTIDLEELQKHLHSLPDKPDVIPYVTSYYKRDLKPGSLTYGELVIPGKSNDEVLFSTYVCHPSMANNELSGPVIATYLAKWITKIDRNYTYRFVFVPETIGTVVYLSNLLNHLKKHVRAGFVLTCCGDEGRFSFMPSRTGQTYADKVARRVLAQHAPDFIEYSFLQRGSDERQYCSPLVDLPVASVMRSKYHEYPEYHTSADDLTFVTPRGLQTTLNLYSKLIDTLEGNRILHAVVAGEPQLGKRGLYPNIGGQVDQKSVSAILDLLAFADGTNDVVDIANATGHDLSTLNLLSDTLIAHGLLTTNVSHD